MIISIKNIGSADRSNVILADGGLCKNLDISFDENSGILWKFISAESTPHFSHDLLDDIRSVQSSVRDRLHGGGELSGGKPIKYIVFGSNIPGVFSLGGDLRLFRRLIANKDRAGLTKYSKKATDAVFHHASNFGDAMSFSLVQGAAMGGGFEAALAGNILVAESGTRLGFPEVLFGLFPGMGAYTFLRRRVDALTAEKIILSAKNYSAEELHDIGVVDILCEPGDGRRAIESYISRQSSRPGAVAFRRALNHAHCIDRNELYAIADEWVETALNLAPEHIRRIDRLVCNQQKNFPCGESEAHQPALASAM